MYHISNWGANFQHVGYVLSQRLLFPGNFENTDSRCVMLTETRTSNNQNLILASWHSHSLQVRNYVCDSPSLRDDARAAQLLSEWKHQRCFLTRGSCSLASDSSHQPGWHLNLQGVCFPSAEGLLRPHVKQTDGNEMIKIRINRDVGGEKQYFAMRIEIH